METGGLSNVDLPDDDPFYWWMTILSVCFSVVVVIVLLNLLITILMDKYSEAKDSAQMEWCKKQAISIHIEDTLQVREFG